MNNIEFTVLQAANNYNLDEATHGALLALIDLDNVQTAQFFLAAAEVFEQFSEECDDDDLNEVSKHLTSCATHLV